MAARILIVDDEPAILATMAPLLRARGYDVATATSGHAALEAVDRQPPQLVILDLGLPDLDGIEVLRRLRARGDHTPVLILTANDAISSRVRGLDSGADDYLVKPFEVEELEARIRAQLRRGRTARGSAPHALPADVGIPRCRRDRAGPDRG